MTPSPPVGFNLTFVCPDKQVFESDWLAIPFVMMTCQVAPLFPGQLLSKGVEYFFLGPTKPLQSYV
jgi:hypothetical protein